MKRKLAVLLCCLLLQASGVHAQSDGERFLIMSDDLPWIIDVYLMHDDRLQIGFLPADLMMPVACANDYATSLNTVKMETNQACITKSVEQFLHVEYDHSLYLHMKKLRKDIDLAYPKNGLHTSGELVDYLHDASDKLTLSVLFHYQTYVTSDLSALDYISYYRKLHGKKLAITYTYINYMDFEDISIPLSFRMQPIKK